MGVLHGNRDKVEPPGPNLVKSRDALAEPIIAKKKKSYIEIWKGNVDDPTNVHGKLSTIHIESWNPVSPLRTT